MLHSPASTGPRLLVLMRHAKADSVGESDHARRLTASGVDDAQAAGRWLAGQGVRPDHALVSDAQRTRDTFAAVAQGAGWDVAASYDDGLYAAGPETALDLIRRSDAQAGSVIVIGHNPTVASLAQALDNGEGDAQAGIALTMGFPPCAVAVFEYDGAWSDLDQQCAMLTAFYVGGAG